MKHLEWLTDVEIGQYLEKTPFWPEGKEWEVNLARLFSARDAMRYKTMRSAWLRLSVVLCMNAVMLLTFANATTRDPELGYVIAYRPKNADADLPYELYTSKLPALLPTLNVAITGLSLFHALRHLVVCSPVIFDKLTDRQHSSSVCLFRATIGDPALLYELAYLGLSLLGYLHDPVYASVLLLDVLALFPDARNVLMALWIPRVQLGYVFVLMLFTVFVFALVIL